jgi:hypothetical protein
MQNPNQPSYYATIPASVRYHKKVCANAKLLYGELSALANKEGYAWASNDYFAKLYRVHEKTVSAWVAELKRAGKINVEMIPTEKGTQRRIYIAGKGIHEKTETHVGGVREKTETPPRIPDDPPPSFPDPNITRINTTKNIKPIPKFTFTFEEGFIGIPYEDMQRWIETYPAVFIAGEIKKAAEWLRSNPTKRKSNYRRFLTNWFSRTQERGGTTGYHPPVARPAPKPAATPEPLSESERQENIKSLSELKRKLVQQKRMTLPKRPDHPSVRIVGDLEKL